MKEIDRRTFLKFGMALTTGIVTAELMIPVSYGVNEGVRRITGHKAGNANIKQKIEESCKDTVNPQECFQNYKSSSRDKVMGGVVAPISEEITFRAIPSASLSDIEGRKNPIGDVLHGTGGFGMTRRELLVGVASSIIFAAVHNITSRGGIIPTGIDTKTVPASQAVGGMVYWYLQRKFGIAFNTVAHIWNNFRALT